MRLLTISSKYKHHNNCCWRSLCSSMISRFVRTFNEALTTHTDTHTHKRQLGADWTALNFVVNRLNTLATVQFWYEQRAHCIVQTNIWTSFYHCWIRYANWYCLMKIYTTLIQTMHVPHIIRNPPIEYLCVYDIVRQTLPSNAHSLMACFTCSKSTLECRRLVLAKTKLN